MGSRRQRRQRHTGILRMAGIIGVIVLVAAMYMCYIAFSSKIVPVAAIPRQENHSDLPSYILSLGIPGLGQAARTTDTVKVEQEYSMRTAMLGAVLHMTGVDAGDLRSIFRAEIPVLTAFVSGPSTVNAASIPYFPNFKWKDIVPAGKPLVGIYHTHTSESFIPWSGAAHAPGGKQGDIVAAGEALVNKLAEHGIPALQSKKVHDYPSFMKAYGPSEETAKNMLSENPSLQMIFDFHRDAGTKDDCTAVVNGLPTARIMIVVATGQEGLPQPHWQQNHAFAKLIDAKLNQHYPGLSRGIRLDDWRYNQHLFPRALLIEVGCQENEKEEVLRSMSFLADVLAEILAES
ncbi:MAG: stage sporulation protein [Firmicutes bacterium]|nr:stage sporulation protein [Bacillota bacterium]